ncbi:MAG: 50S ribosomal protein L22 [Spirochaetota bacterium]
MSEDTKINENELITTRHISKFNIISPYKVRKVMNKLKGMHYEKAIALMETLPHKSASIIGKSIKSAFYNMDNNYDNIDPDKVFIHELYATAGPILKRIKPRARGRADRIKKRTTHVTVILGTKRGESK